jgi:hypothetical protein
MGKTILFSAIILMGILAVGTTLPALAIVEPGPPNIARHLEKIGEHLSKISDHLDKVLSSDACQNKPPPNGIPDDSCATRLGNIAERLGNVADRLNHIQANQPPGPPQDAALIKNLDTIINLANHIADIAKQAPGPPTEPPQ